MNCEGSICTVTIPTMIKNLNLNSIKCPYYDNDREKTIKEYLECGGVMAAVARLKGKRTEIELKEVKKSKRKLRTDIGKKRTPKKENSLKEIL